MSDDLRRLYLMGSSHSLYGNLPGDELESQNDNRATYNSGFGTEQATAHTFAAIPRPYERPQDYWHGPRDYARPPYVNRAASLKPDGTLNLQNKDWSGTTYMLAPCPPSTARREVKAMVLDHAVEHIRATGARWKNKTDCLINHFNQGLILTQAALAIQDLSRYESTVYDYNFLGIQNAGHRAVNIPAIGTNEANFRSAARYVITEMTINARRRYAIPGKPGNHLIPGADSKTVMFRLPLDINGTLHGDIPLHVLRDMRQLLIQCQYLEETHQFGMADREQFSQDKFTHWIEDIKQQTKYEIVARLIKPSFVGEGILETPTNRLIQCRQLTTDEKGQAKALAVLEHYDKFQAIAQQLNAEIPYPVHLPTTFFNSLTTHLQDKINRRGYRLPPPGNNQAQLIEIQQLRDIAKEEEKDLEAQIGFIRSTLQSGGQQRTAHGTHQGAYASKPANRPTTRAFMATHQYNGGGGDNNDTGQNKNYDDDDPLTEQFTLLQGWMNRDPTFMTSCFMSPAETALRSASGTQRPIECWGCSGHPTFHETRYHSFRDCPNKWDPDVRKAAFRRMKQMREEWEERKLEADPEGNKRKRDGNGLMAKADAMRNWRELGFSTKREAERAADAAALMTVDISDRNRSHLMRAYNRKWIAREGQAATEPTETTTNYEYYGRNSDNNTGNQFAHNFIVRVFQAVPVTRIPLEISPTLPHCHFPIGTQHGKGKLMVALDSCAGVNIGHLTFHKAMAEVFPEMVASFKTMEAYGEREINIGGVEVSAANLKITHIIEYRTPFRYNGAPCNLTFGLSEHAAATAIISINFLRKTKAL